MWDAVSLKSLVYMNVPPATFLGSLRTFFLNDRIELSLAASMFYIPSQAFLFEFLPSVDRLSPY